MAERSHWDRVVELARISMENPAVMAVLRLHFEEYGSCAECGSDKGTWPCPTVLAIEQVAARPGLIVIDPDVLKRAQPSGWRSWGWNVMPRDLPGHPLVQPKES